MMDGGTWTLRIAKGAASSTASACSNVHKISKPFIRPNGEWRVFFDLYAAKGLLPTKQLLAVSEP
jgi:hypothetical protein